MAIESSRIRQETVWAEDSNPLPDLPHEIIVEILPRLPVKTLLRFKSVCKSWRSLISHPKFVQTHLSLASLDTDYTQHRLLLRGNDLHHDLKSCSIFSIMYEQSDTAASLDYPFDGSPNWVWIVGSCNGLVCIIIQKRTVFLWNPSTRKSNKLPRVEMLFDKCPVYVGDRYPLSGFGYDESTDDYKVVLIFQVEYRNTVVVYGLRTDSWRKIEDLPHPLHVAGSGKYASGALHWTASGKSKEVIVSLDLAKEKYGEVSQPDYEDGYFDLTMDVLGGCLCMLCTYIGVGADLWVMKEYGIGESWIKLVAIHDHAHSLYGQQFIPKCILKNGEILMAVSGRLVQYNSKDGKFYYPTIHKCFPTFSAYPYVESLVSPDSDAHTGV